MTKVYKTIIDATTDEVVRVELTAEELAERETMRVQAEAEQAAREAAEQAKEDAKASGIAKLLALGLTEEEANALLA